MIFKVLSGKYARYVNYQQAVVGDGFPVPMLPILKLNGTGDQFLHFNTVVMIFFKAVPHKDCARCCLKNFSLKTAEKYKKLLTSIDVSVIITLLFKLMLLNRGFENDKKKRC